MHVRKIYLVSLFLSVNPSANDSISGRIHGPMVPVADEIGQFLQKIAFGRTRTDTLSNTSS